MKAIIFLLSIISTTAFAQSDCYENRYSVRGTQITPSSQGGFNKVNGYYYNAATKTYYKGKNINRDASSQPSPQGCLSFTYDKNQYAPTNLSISK